MMLVSLATLAWAVLMKGFYWRSKPVRFRSCLTGEVRGTGRTVQRRVPAPGRSNSCAKAASSQNGDAGDKYQCDGPSLVHFDVSLRALALSWARDALRMSTML
jgi:hypothetical protein